MNRATVAIAAALHRANPGQVAKGESGREAWNQWRADCLHISNALAALKPVGFERAAFLLLCGSPD